MQLEECQRHTVEELYNGGMKTLVVMLASEVTKITTANNSEIENLKQIAMNQQTLSTERFEKIKELSQRNAELEKGALEVELLRADNSAYKKRIQELEAAEKWHRIDKPQYVTEKEELYDLPPESGEYQVCKMINGRKVVTTDEWDVDGHYWANSAHPEHIVAWTELATAPKF